MVDAGSFKNGITIEYDNNIYQVIEFQHVKPGKGAAFVRTKLKDIVNGGVIETSFRPTDKFENAHIDRREMQYLYKDEDFYHFMDNETFEQIDLPSEICEASMKFVKENELCKIVSCKGEVFAIEPPIQVSLLVTECEPGVKGNTATGATKPCVVETGARINVPLFVNEGDTIKVDTRTEEYVSRA